MIVGGIEEIRLDEPAGEMYVADSYLGGRVMVFDLKTFAFKRGWGAYGRPLSQVTTDDADRAYVAGGPMPREFRGHLTINISNDGLVYAADRNANRIHVTDKGQVLKVHLAEHTGIGGSTGGVAFFRQAATVPLHLGLTNNHIYFSTARTAKKWAAWAAWARTAAPSGAPHDRRGLEGNVYRGGVRWRARAAVRARRPQGRLLEQLSRLQPERRKRPQGHRYRLASRPGVSG
jgi:hypothetical protein